MSAEAPTAPVALAGLRAKTIEVRNSRLVCWSMFVISIAAVILGILMIVIACGEFLPYRGVSFMRILNTVQWAFGGVAMMSMGPAVWQWARRMSFYKAKLDPRGVDFTLGTRRNPEQVLIAWDQVASVEQRRAGGNILLFTIKGKDGSYATYSATTFFRPKHLARLIAHRAGTAVQEV